MILVFSIFWFLVGGLLAWLAARWSTVWPRWISLITLGIHLIPLLVLWVDYLGPGGASNQGQWLAQLNLPWIPQLGISFFLGMDGVSLLLVILSNSWDHGRGGLVDGIQYRVGFFHFNLLWILAAIVGVFLSLDLFLFYVFWEMMLVPLYFLIGIWGHENRVYATLKSSSSHRPAACSCCWRFWALFRTCRSTGVYTFNYLELLGTSMAPATAFWLMLGFFIAFGVKLPVFPLHTWLPDAHTEAPTAGSVDLAGLV